MVRAYYAKSGNGNGGNLHVVLEDPNYEDAHVTECLARALETGDHDGALIAEKLLLMSKTQRKKIATIKGYPPYRDVTVSVVVGP